MYYLTLEDIKYIFAELHHFFSSHNDPVPHFNSSYHEKVESIIYRPQDTFDSKDLYPDIYAKAACYFYFTNTLHPFMNGNKRMSIVMTYVFLRKNGYIFQAEEDEIYDFAKDVSQNHNGQDGDFHEVVEFIKMHTIPLRFFGPIDIEGVLQRFLFWFKR